MGDALQLAGRVIAVTGGFGQLGRAVGAQLRQRGAKVVLLDRTSVPAGVDSDLMLGSVDLADPASASRAFDEVEQRFARLDGVVNVAGGFRWETVVDGSIDTWDLLYSMNVRTAVVASRAALPALLRRGMGRIVNVGALASIQASSGMGAYAASKAGVSRLTEALAEELKDRGITVNAVLPSLIDTPANRADMPDADAGRWVSPRALASVIAFLLSDDASAITGALLPVRGKV